MNRIAKVDFDKHNRELIDGKVVEFSDDSLTPTDRKFHQRIEMARQASLLINLHSGIPSFDQKPSSAEPRHRAYPDWEAKEQK